MVSQNYESIIIAPVMTRSETLRFTGVFNLKSQTKCQKG